jgi:uncharacterized protein (DUF1697 family)
MGQPEAGFCLSTSSLPGSHLAIGAINRSLYRLPHLNILALTSAIINRMPKYIAFLRAINVGGHTVKMDSLRGLFEEMGFTRVETIIASGNVLFDATNLDSQSIEKQIQASLQKALGYPVPAFVRSLPELAEIAHSKPFPDVELDMPGNQIYIGFLANQAGLEAQQKVRAHATADDDFYFQGREMFWLRRKKISESKFFGPQLEKALGMETTLRNSTTVKKIAEKYT